MHQSFKALRTLQHGCASLALAASLLAPVAGAEQLPLKHFTRNDVVGAMQISPDGSSYFVTAGRYGRETLLFLGRDNLEQNGGVRARPGNALYNIHWVSSNRVIFSQAEQQIGRAAPAGIGEIFGIDVDGKNGERIYGLRAGDAELGSRISNREDTMASGHFLSRLKENDDRILITERPYKQSGAYIMTNPDAHPRIASLHVYTGRKSWVDSLPLASADALVDRNDEVRFAIGYGEDARLAVVWRPQPEDDWESFNLPGFRDDSVVPQAFSADNESVLLTGVREGESLNALYRLDLRNESIEMLYRHETADVDSVITGPTTGEVIGVRVHAAKPEMHWLDENHPDARFYRMLEQGFPGRTVSITNSTDDGRYAVVFVSSDINPGDYYLFDTETRNAEYLYAARQWVDPREMRPKQPISLEARDGLALQGYLTTPASGDGPYPMIVLPHGGPHSVRDEWVYDWEVQLFANRGYAVLQVNFRGSYGYGIDFEVAGYEQWGASMQDDITDATRWAIEEGIADADRICIVGASYGGYAALMGVIREPKLYRCAIGHAGVYDLELMFKSGDLPRSNVGADLLRVYLGEDQDRLRRYSPTSNADRIEVPVMLVHGKDDLRVDYQHAKRMKDALDDAGKPYEWVALGEEGHGIYDEDTREDVYRQMLGFLDSNMN